MNHTVVITVVIPTLGRESLRLTLHALLAAPGTGRDPRRARSSWWTTAPRPARRCRCRRPRGRRSG
ncbi:hypothetical protein LUX57_02710 [Actinomadura madurae]|uniref:hypothetical protein n=1 Tax=Actinomadura madurae TaxID=1993 RepID=UPI0020D23841|nr:hypothetical protein [Actinomadura madurae]MCP9964232.1 hypothetical protein [Actinomadura madurae]